jgi:hypothetical protein
MVLRPCFACLAIALLGAIACTDTESATNLRTSGPPMIEQIRVDEGYLDAEMPPQHSTRRDFAFGTFPTAVVPDEVHPLDCLNADGNCALAVQGGFGIRVIMGSLLVGNYLEQILCREVVGADAYDNVPLGTTPDDIARCSVPMDPAVLAESCSGDHAVCLCHLQSGCNGAAGPVDFGKPVGVVDTNQDGAADTHRFIDGAVGIQCHDDAMTRTINVPINTADSYWYPSGFQGVPATGGFEALGPAIVLKHGGADGSTSAHPAMPTNMICGLTFSPDVVGKNNEQVCAPPHGRPGAGTGDPSPGGCDDLNIDQCPQTCVPGDVSAVTFRTEPLQMKLASFPDGGTGVSRTDPVALISVDNVPLDPGQVGTIQVLQCSDMSCTTTTPYTQYTVALNTNNTANSEADISWTSPTGLAATTTYQIIVPVVFHDTWGIGPPMPQKFTFTTGA